VADTHEGLAHVRAVEQHAKRRRCRGQPRHHVLPAAFWARTKVPSAISNSQRFSVTASMSSGLVKVFAAPARARACAATISGADTPLAKEKFAGGVRWIFTNTSSPRTPGFSRSRSTRVL
jgi:hypothetical protein